MNAYRIPFRPGHHMAAVDVRFGRNVEGTMLVDTGAQRSMVTPDMARRLDLDLERPESRLTVHGIGGQRSALLCRVDRLAIGAVVILQHPVIVASLPPVLRVDGILGLDVLARFRVTFEFDTRTLVLRSV